MADRTEKIPDITVDNDDDVDNVNRVPKETVEVNTVDDVPEERASRGAEYSRQSSAMEEIDIQMGESSDHLSDPPTPDVPECLTPSPYLPDRNGNRKRSSVTLAPGTITEKPHPSQRKMTSKRSSFIFTPKPLKHYLTKEVLPHVDHYRNRMSFSKGKTSRFTLNFLRKYIILEILNLCFLKVTRKGLVLLWMNFWTRM